jgi:hypothetical protein
MASVQSSVATRLYTFCTPVRGSILGWVVVEVVLLFKSVLGGLRGGVQ